MGKSSKRKAEEAGLVTVVPESSSAAAVQGVAADASEVMDVDVSVSKKKSKKDKPSKKSKDGKESSSKDEAALNIPADALSPIARPLAGRKFAKKTLKTVKKGEEQSYREQHQLLACSLLNVFTMLTRVYFRISSCKGSSCQARCQGSRQRPEEGREGVSDADLKYIHASSQLTSYSDCHPDSS